MDKLFEAKIKPDGDCLIWQGHKHKLGYGQVQRQGKVWQAHRWAYLLEHGNVPPCLDHLCRRRDCVNAEHLEPVTQKENLYRGVGTIAPINAAKTHCPHGHEYTKENTRHYRHPKNKYWGRWCRACDKARPRRAPY